MATACRQCNGSGEMPGIIQPETSFDPQDAVGGMVECPQCKGTGEVPDDEEILEELDRMLDRRAMHQSEFVLSVAFVINIRDRIAYLEKDAARPNVHDAKRFRAMDETGREWTAWLGKTVNKQIRMRPVFDYESLGDAIDEFYGLDAAIAKARP